MRRIALGANFVDAPEAVIFFMALAFFGNGMASIGWSIISSLAPRGLIGLTGGAFNFISGANGSGANNTIKAHGFVLANVVNF